MTSSGRAGVSPAGGGMANTAPLCARPWQALHLLPARHGAHADPAAAWRYTRSLMCEKNRGHAGEEQHHACCDFRREPGSDDEPPQPTRKRVRSAQTCGKGSRLTESNCPRRPPCARPGRFIAAWSPGTPRRPLDPPHTQTTATARGAPHSSWKYRTPCTHDPMEHSLH